MFLISPPWQAAPCHFEIPDLWRRYLGVILDGMRPEPATPLTPDAPTMDEVERALGAVSARAGTAQREVTRPVPAGRHAPSVPVGVHRTPGTPAGTPSGRSNSHTTLHQPRCPRVPLGRSSTS